MNESMRLIIGFVANLMFTTKIEQAAHHVGFDTRWLDGDGGQAVQEGLGEKLNGRLGQHFQTITRAQPALLLFDLDNADVPWEQWIPAFNTSPATRRIPILCFGSHHDAAQMKRAAEVGATRVLARSAFMADMPALLSKYARLPDSEAIETACDQPLSPDGREGIALFNAGEYYAAHDAFEAAWKADETHGRDLYRLMLQTAVSLHQIQRGNYRGAVKMLMRLHGWLAPLPARCRGVDIAQLAATVTAVEAQLQLLGADKLADFEWAVVQPIVMEQVSFAVDVQVDTAVSDKNAAIVKTAVVTTLQQQAIAPPAALTLVLTDDAAVRRLNRDYRALDQFTDVLSFPAGEQMPGMETPYLGDIIISVPFAAQQAAASGHSTIAELQLLAVHGTLHLLGHDHADMREKERMWAAQTAVLTTLGLSDINPTEAAH